MSGGQKDDKFGPSHGALCPTTERKRKSKETYTGGRAQLPILATQTLAQQANLMQPFQ
jgi:hypothetical protein